MKDLIQELAEQAGLRVDADGEIGPAYTGSVDAGYRKFAELIIEECAKACDEQGKGRKALEHYAALTYVGATNDCASAIRERMK